MADSNKMELTEENIEMVQFMKEFLVVLKRHGLVEEGDSNGVPDERAAHVMLSEIHDWYRTGRIGSEAESFTKFCEQAQEVNYEVDDIEGEYSAGD